jgi:hypothetical protein
VAQGVLRAADPVLDPSVCAVARVKLGELPEWGVGGERGVAPAVALFERVELRAGVRALAAHDDSGPGRVAAQCSGREDVGDLGQPGAVAVPTGGVDRVGPDSGRDDADRGPFLVFNWSLIAQPTEKLQLTARSRSPRMWARNSRVQPAVSARIRIGVPCR